MEIKMDINQFIKELNNVDWHKYDNKVYFQYRHDGINTFSKIIPKVLESLAFLDKEEKSNEELIKNGKNIGLLLNGKMYNEVLSTIGNNHGGTYYTVIEKALPFILKVALFGNHVVARNCAINCLIDLYHFEADDGSHKNNVSEPFIKTKKEEQLETYVKNIIEENKNNFIKLSMEDIINRKLLKKFIEEIDGKE